MTAHYNQEDSLLIKSLKPELSINVRYDEETGQIYCTRAVPALSPLVSSSTGEHRERLLEKLLESGVTVGRPPETNRLLNSRTFSEEGAERYIRVMEAAREEALRKVAEERIAKELEREMVGLQPHAEHAVLAPLIDSGFSTDKSNNSLSLFQNALQCALLNEAQVHLLPTNKSVNSPRRRLDHFRNALSRKGIRRIEGEAPHIRVAEMYASSKENFNQYNSLPHSIGKVAPLHVLAEQEERRLALSLQKHEALLFRQQREAALMARIDWARLEQAQLVREAESFAAAAERAWDRANRLEEIACDADREIQRLHDNDNGEHVRLEVDALEGRQSVIPFSTDVEALLRSRLARSRQQEVDKCIDDLDLMQEKADYIRQIQKNHQGNVRARHAKISVHVDPLHVRPVLKLYDFLRSKDNDQLNQSEMASPPTDAQNGTPEKGSYVRGNLRQVHFDNGPESKEGDESRDKNFSPACFKENLERGSKKTMENLPSESDTFAESDLEAMHELINQVNPSTSRNPRPLSQVPHEYVDTSPPRRSPSPPTLCTSTGTAPCEISSTASTRGSAGSSPRSIPSNSTPPSVQGDKTEGFNMKAHHLPSPYLRESTSMSTPPVIAQTEKTTGDENVSMALAKISRFISNRLETRADRQVLRSLRQLNRLSTGLNEILSHMRPAAVDSPLTSTKSAMNATVQARHEESLGHKAALIELLLQLDAVESCGKDIIREKRRAIIADVEKELNAFEEGNVKACEEKVDHVSDDDDEM